MCLSYVKLSRSPKKGKKVTTYKDIQAAVSFKAELDMLQNTSFQFEPDTPPTIPLNVKNLCLQLKRGLSELKISSCTSQPRSNFPHLSTISYFTSGCILLAHRYIHLSTISSSDHLVPQLPWAVYQEQSLSFPAQVSLTSLKEWSGKQSCSKGKDKSPPICVCTQNEKSRGIGLSQCPPGRQDDTVPPGAQAQNPLHCQHPLAEHFYGAASIQAWARWKPLARVCATSSKDSCSTLQLFGTHMEVLHCQQTKPLKFLCPAPKQDLWQLKGQFWGRQSERQPKKTHLVYPLFY